MLIDFIEMQHELHGQRFDKFFYKWILNSEETADFAHLWAVECRRYYIDKYTAADKEDIDDLEVRTSIYCSRLVETPEIITDNSKCLSENWDKYLNFLRIGEK